MSRPARIALTVDVGPAGAVLGAGHAEGADWSTTWRGIDVLCEVFGRAQDALGMPVVATWFCRADALVLRQLGSRVDVFGAVAACIDRHGRTGDELAWMPQVYSGSGAVGYDDLATTHRAVTRHLGTPPRSIRMGDLFHDDRTMEIVSRLGLRVDSSALPGRTKADGGWRLDWLGTPAHPYRPSLADYRVPGEPCHGVLEVPLTMGAIKAPYDEAPLIRHLNPAWHRRYVSEALDALTDPGAARDHVVCLVHPDEVVAQPEELRHPLGAYSPEELYANIELLHEAAAGGRRDVRFVRLEDLVP